jgi:hypothetical protein
LLGNLSKQAVGITKVSALRLDTRPEQPRFGCGAVGISQLDNFFDLFIMSKKLTLFLYAKT